MVLERSHLNSPHLGDREIQGDRLHHPRVRTPFTVGFFRDPELSRIQSGDRIVDCPAVLLFLQQHPVLERGFYLLSHLRTSLCGRTPANTCASLAGQLSSSGTPNVLSPLGTLPAPARGQPGRSLHHRGRTRSRAPRRCLL